MNAFRDEFAGEFFGVKGRFHNVHLWPVDTNIPERSHGKFSTQSFISERRVFVESGTRYVIWFTARFDDVCRNGRHSFAVTGEIWRANASGSPVGIDSVACGVIHDDLAKRFPEIADVLKWHLCDEAGPMHYGANAVYLAGDRDHHGLRKGERRQIINGKTKLPAWQLVAVNADGVEIELHKLDKYIDAASKPQTIASLEYRPWYREGEGKARDFDGARRVAVWLDATDAELSVEPEELRAALAARLPALVSEFRAMIDSSGFLWSAETRP